VRDRILWSSCLIAVLTALSASILLYPDWKKGFGTFQNDLAISAASRGDGQFVDVSSDASAFTQILRLPVQHPVAGQSWCVQFTYPGTKDARSKAAEVWILGVTAGKALDFHRIPTAAGWELRLHPLGTERYGLVGHTGTSGVQQVALDGGTLSVRLLRHDRGGFVRLSVNGDQQDINLYSPTPGIATLTWQPALPPDEVGPSQPLHAHASKAIGQSVA
jgi:hypothetical protein